jgi:sulfite exporter TauE/SafE
MNASLAAILDLCTPGAVQGGLLAGLFVAGAAGSVVHCVPMCGALVLGQVADRMARLTPVQMCERQRLRIGLLLPYHFGRLTTYAALGALAATTAAVLGHAAWFAALSSVLLAVAALLFLYSATARLLPLSVATPRPPASWGAMIRRMTAPIDRRRAAGSYLLGLALGLLPCGFVYTALVAAAATAQPAWGAAAMLAFGLGTVPALVVVGVAGQAAGRSWRRGMTVLAPVVLGINGVLLFGLALRQWSGIE